METPKYNLDDLAAECKINVRTIRSYFAAGLLKGAVQLKGTEQTDRVGRGKHYTQYHVDRLKVIRLLRSDKNDKQPLGVIRNILVNLDDEGLQKIIAVADANPDETVVCVELPGFSKKVVPLGGPVGTTEPGKSDNERILRELEDIKTRIEDLKQTIEEKL